MSDVDSTTDQHVGRREQKKEAIRKRIIEELVHMIFNGEEITHDFVAGRAEVSRRTVYRYFPDRDSLLESVWEHLQEVAGGRIHLPRTEADLTDSLYDIFSTFDQYAAFTTLMACTLQGRAIRISNKKRRTDAYRAATADAVKDLSPEDRKLATAVIQVLHAYSWLEYHDQWDLTAPQMTRATTWAIRTLLDDLRTRKGRPLDTARPRGRNGK